MGSALGAFDPSFLSRAPQINYGPSATDLYGKYLSLQGMMEQQKIRQIQLQQEQMQLQQQQQAARDRAALAQYLQSTPDLTTPAAQRQLLGYGAPGAAALTSIRQADKEQFEANKARYELNAKKSSDYADRIYGLSDLPEDQRLPAYQAAAQWAYQNGVIDQGTYAQIAGLTAMRTPEELASEGMRFGGASHFYDFKKRREEQQQAALKLADEQRASAATDMRQLPTDPATGLPTQESWTDFLKTHPAIARNAPPAPTKDYIDRVVTAGIAEKDLPKYQEDVAKAAAYQALVKKPREQWMTEAAQAVPAELHIGDKTFDTSGLQERTLGEVKSRLDGGDYAGAQKAIEKGQQSLADTEKTYRGAAVTAPIKIEVGAGLAGAKAPQTTTDAIDVMAEDWINGKPPSTRNQVLYAKVANRRAELLKERGLTAQAAIAEQHAAQANTKALDTLTKQYEVLKPFGETAERSAALLEQRLGEVTDLGSSLLNTPIRDLEAKFGSTKVAALRAALLPVQADFGRILNSPTGAAAVHVGAQNEMRQALPEGATVGQVRAALDVFRQDWRMRKEETEAAKRDLAARSVVGGAGAPQQTTGATGDYVRTATGSNGHKIGQKADGSWYDLQTGNKL